VLWSGLYPSQKHLAWLLCSGIIHGCLVVWCLFSIDILHGIAVVVAKTILVIENG